MAKRDDTVPSDLRDLLVMLRDALGQPPLGALLATLAIRTIRLLAEQDLDRRLAMREQIRPTSSRPGASSPRRSAARAT